MSAGVISRRYARALMNLAVQGDQVEPVAASLDALADSMVDSPLLGAFLGDAKVPPKAKLEAVEAILKGIQAHPLVETFTRFITSKRRIALLPDIREVFHRLADQRLGRAQAEVTVAAAISGEQEAGLLAGLEGLTGKKITLTVHVNPDILGGAVTRIGSTVRDGSLKTHLSNLRQSILEG